MSDSTKRGYAAYTTESSQSLVKILNVTAWVALFALIAITGVHAVSIVIRHHGSGAGILYWMRVAAPIMTEVFTALVTVGFALHIWRGVQRWIALGVEIVWILFAALNLISDFTMEAGGAIGGALGYWVAYGLPVSALITGTMFYFTLRTSPENTRIEAEKAAANKRAEEDFGARQDVFDTAEYEMIRRRRVWLDIANGLKREGYDDHEIAFMTQRTPQLTGYDPNAHTPVVLENQADEPPAARSWLDRLRGRQPAPQPTQAQPAAAPAQIDEAALTAVIAGMIARGELAVPVGQNTYAAAQPAQPAAGQGQGNGPAGHRIGGQHPNE